MPAIIESAMPSPSLSRREAEVLRLLADGCSSKEIAQRMDLSPATIMSYRKNLYRKLNVSSRSQAVALGKQSGFLQIMPVTPPLGGA